MSKYTKLYNDGIERDSDYHVKRIKTDKWSCQNTFTLLGFIGIALGFAMRGTLSVTIVAIAKQPDLLEVTIKKQTDEFSCLHEEFTNNTMELIKTEFTMSRTERGLALAGSIIGLVFSNLLGGIAAGRYGGKLVVGLGVLLSSILTIAAPLIIQYSISLFILARFLMGITEGVILPGVFQIIGSWALPEERSRVVGAIKSGTYIGLMTVLFLSGIISQSSFLGGWPSVFYLFGGLGLIWTIFWFCFVYEKPEIHPKISDWELKKLRSCSHTKYKLPKLITFISIFKSKPLWGVVLMHCGVNFCFNILLTELPSYFAQIHHMEITKNGFLSSLPYFTCWIVTYCFSSLMTKLTVDNKITIVNVRRLSMALTGYVSAVCFIVLCFVGCNRNQAVALIVLIQGIAGCLHSGSSCSFVDLAPRYSGIVMGISSTFANIFGFSSTLILEHLLDHNPSLLGWQYGFLLTAAIYFVSTTVYLSTVVVEIQPWNYDETDQEVEEETNGLIGSGEAEDSQI